MTRSHACTANHTPWFAGIWQWSLLCLPLLTTAAAAASSMPYNPTRILQDGDHAYVFHPSSDDSAQFQLSVIDYSSNIAAANMPYTNLYSTLPFLDAKSQRPFNAILNGKGNITVYTGDCTLGASGAQVWSFVPESPGRDANGSWTRQDTTFARDSKHLLDMGPNYLSAGIAFSATVDSDVMSTSAYFFGGMCPFQGTKDTDWQSAANYSNLMITLDPSQSSAKSVTYQVDVSSSRGPPIAEAGFSLTPLIPSFSNRSDGAQIQQQSFALIGGHTSSAFINTSQIAIFSLPQQGWTFVPVAQPDTSRTDLSIRNEVDAIEPRSGHSAVLSPDGQSMVIFGGWIGDINTPADPPLAVLNVGDGYGGHGPWQWSVPIASGPGLPDGSGIYGHGAVMLPGSVMMIIGGYKIPTSTSHRRRAASANSQTLFFNLTSNAWISEYSPPPEIASSPPASTGPLSTMSQKAGLGAGLGIGMAAVLGLMGFYFWYTRKLRKQREVREKQLSELSRGAYRYSVGPIPSSTDGRDGQNMYHVNSNDSFFHPVPDHQQNSGWRRANSYEAERTGLLVEIPSPTRGLRRSLGHRPNQPMSRYDEKRMRGSGNIHPIDELDEEQEMETSSEQTPLTRQPEMQEIASHSRTLSEDTDPFTDHHHTGNDRSGPFHSVPTSPSQDVVYDLPHKSPKLNLVGAVDLPRCSGPSLDGRDSPTKSSYRTGSDLSERSARSMRSAMRSPTVLNIDVSADIPTESNARPNTANADAESFTTARSSFMALKSEGEALLGGNPERTRPTTSSTSDGSNGHLLHDIEDSTSRCGTTTTAATSRTEGLARAAFGRERRKSLMGTVKRALSRTTAPGNRTKSMTNATMHFESYKDDPEATDHSVRAAKHKSLPAPAPPRRAVSDASAWRSRRGKQDWEDDELDPTDPRARWRRNSGDDWGAPEDVAFAEQQRQRREWRERGNLLINLTDDDRLPTPDSPIHGRELGVPTNRERPCTPADEDDWDVEAAVERRVVQVMFTVPRSKLRVVNADVDRSSLLSLGRETSNDSVEIDQEHKDPPIISMDRSNLVSLAEETSNDNRDINEEAKDPPAISDSSSSNSSIGKSTYSTHGTPSRVKDLAGKFEQLSSPQRTPRASPRPSPSPSIKSMKIRGKNSSASLNNNNTPRKNSAHSMVAGAIEGNR
ncbi:unnamed protein product [Periconia digitata]|uniref:Uncharacterized protein n=1 Tax=Periconia digitata TaxID=1303443 RepID=A0A9W4UN26_9PLEO|nr:unnamed protein product [Periconia digitata]